MTLEWPTVEIQAGSELDWMCQSQTLGNDEALYVNGVHSTVGPGWHHSNWFFVPEDMYEGPDGTWNCDERNFDEVTAALAGGVLFAQSTQAVEETQRFLPGAALVIPPRAKIVFNMHLLNASDVALSSHAVTELELIEEDELEIPLRPLSLTYRTLDIPPRATSRFTGACDFATPWGAPIDFRVHYVMPHYHSLGRELFIEAMGGEVDGQTVFRRTSSIGDPLGGTLDPPFHLAGATGMRFGCVFDNPRDEAVGWGNGDQEMCMLLAFVDGTARWAGIVDGESTQTGTDGDIMDYEGPCTVYPLP